MPQTRDASSSEISGKRTTQSSAQRELSARDELVGRTIGNYQLEKRLGGGAMASVYRATDVRTGELAALKLLLPGADTAMRERFRREVQTVSQLSFPNIVRTLEVSSQASSSGSSKDLADSDIADSDLAYIAMELVEGESLAQLLEQNGQLSMIDSCALLAPIARALAFAHERGVIHRDVKPSNILLRRSNWNDPNAVRIAAIDSPVVPLLSDFGIALVLDAPELTSAGRTIGTPAYMAPEQCAGSREIDSRADLYAIGAVLYRCLIGRALFLGSTTQILHAHVYDPVSIPDDNMRLLSPLVVEILQLALAKDPQDRYADATELADDLAVAAGHRVRALPRKSTNSEATATMTSLSASSPMPKTATHILIHAPGQNTGRISNGPSPTGKTSVEELSAEEPIIPLIAPRPARNLANRIQPKPQKASWFGLDRSASGRRIASALMAIIALVTIGGAYMMWPRSFQPSLPVRTDPVDLEVASASPMVDSNLSQTSGTKSPGTENGVSLAANAMSASSSVNSSTNLSDSSEAMASATLRALPTTLSISETEKLLTATAVTMVPEAEVTDSAVVPSATVIVSATAIPPSETSTVTSTATSTSTVILTATATRDPALSLAAARAAFAERQWVTVVENLAPLRQSDPNYSAEVVTQLLGESYLLLAARNNQIGDYKSTVELLSNGKTLVAGTAVAESINRLLAATDPLMRPENEGVRDRALQEVQKVHLALATDLVTAAHPCDALEHVKAAKQAYADDAVASVEVKATQQCEDLNKVRNTEDFLANLSGELLYSAKVGSAENASSIFRYPVSQGGSPVLLIRNGRYPMRQRAGTLIAYFNTVSDAPGIYGFDPTINLDPDERGRRIPQQFVEDGRDSTASWNFAGELLVFASTREPDRRSRLYLVDAAPGAIAGTQSSDLVRSFGNWPAWRPMRPSSSGDWVIFNGTNTDGNQPGLWLATNDGIPFSRLTEESGDISPVWTPDGNSVFFANQSRSGNWDIYSISVDAAAIASPVQQITNSTAVDCMPTVSPDGSALAFVSDRGGSWQIWILSIGAAEPILLGDIEGFIPDPSQQSMQWVK